MVSDTQIVWLVASLDFDFDITSFDLGEYFSVCYSHNDRLDLLTNLKTLSFDCKSPINYNRLPGREVELFFSIWLGINPVNPSKNNTPDGHLVVEIKVSIITQFIKPRSNDSVVSDLYKAARLTNIDDVPNRQIPLLNCNRSSKLEYFVAQVSSLLVYFIKVLKLYGCALRFNGIPTLLINNGLSWAELNFAILVMVNYSCSKHALLLGELEYVTCYIIGNFGDFNEAKRICIQLDSDSPSLH